MICPPCAERADRRPNAFAPPELRQGCGEDCGTYGCTCLHRGRTKGHPSITRADFVRLLRQELIGLQINTTELAQATERLRASYCYGMALQLDVPGHDHPHVLTNLALIPSVGNPFEINVATEVDPCPLLIEIVYAEPLASGEDVG